MAKKQTAKFVNWAAHFAVPDSACMSRDDSDSHTGALPVQLVVAAALIDESSRVLVCQRKAGGFMGGYWEFPGGKVHADELPQQALIRELKEELGLETASMCLSPFSFTTAAYDAWRVIVLLYVLRQWSGDICLHVHDDAKWLRSTQLGQIAMLPANTTMLAQIRDLLQ